MMGILSCSSGYSIGIGRKILRRLSLGRLSTAVVNIEDSQMNDNDTTKKDRFYMKLALRHAQHAYRDKEVPIGAILVDEQGEVIAGARNRIEATNDSTAHAEIECIRRASKFLNNWRLINCTLYTTLEPCAMCFSAIQSARIKRVVYASKDVRMGACGSWLNLHQHNHPYHNLEVTGDILAEESTILLKRFFQSVRQDKKKRADYFLGRGLPQLDDNFAFQSYDSTS